MEIPILHIDAFTSKALKGNPEVVCLLDEPFHTLRDVEELSEMEI